MVTEIREPLLFEFTMDDKASERDILRPTIEAQLSYKGAERLLNRATQIGHDATTLTRKNQLLANLYTEEALTAIQNSVRTLVEQSNLLRDFAASMQSGDQVTLRRAAVDEEGQQIVTVMGFTERPEQVVDETLTSWLLATTCESLPANDKTLDNLRQGYESGADLKFSLKDHHNNGSVFVGG